ncbi:MAG: tRNA (guanosine(46)-N7)-methyltransferase TrmB [Erysipelotrichaceae bacterium]|nr:tRNA (guanosine(46)-N7)-methyltransferase TrmB [Erysipelotrichaceae bacterium]
MRMRNLPWAEPFLAEQKAVIKDPAAYKGKWKKTLERSCLHVEIGTGKGDYWIQMGQQYADLGWIGIERNKNVAALAMKKFMQQCPDANHMLFINQDAQSLSSWFDEAEIDVIHLNFSDPWPKKRAHKKRLSNKKFIQQYAYVLHPEGEIQMKTDNAALFEYSLLEFQKEGWILHDISVDFRREEHPEDAISEYETRFMNLGQPIYRAVWKKATSLSLVNEEHQENYIPSIDRK